MSSFPLYLSRDAHLSQEELATLNELLDIQPLIDNDLSLSGMIPSHIYRPATKTNAIDPTIRMSHKREYRDEILFAMI
jgi:hypothetical protein